MTRFGPRPGNVLLVKRVPPSSSMRRKEATVSILMTHLHNSGIKQNYHRPYLPFIFIYFVLVQADYSKYTNVIYAVFT